MQIIVVQADQYFFPSVLCGGKRPMLINNDMPEKHFFEFNCKRYFTRSQYTESTTAYKDT